MKFFGEYETYRDFQKERLYYQTNVWLPVKLTHFNFFVNKSRLNLFSILRAHCFIRPEGGLFISEYMNFSQHMQILKVMYRAF